MGKFLNGFILMNHGRFTKLAKLSCYTVHHYVVMVNINITIVTAELQLQYDPKHIMREAIVIITIHYSTECDIQYIHCSDNCYYCCSALYMNTWIMWSRRILMSVSKVDEFNHTQWEHQFVFFITEYVIPEVFLNIM